MKNITLIFKRSPSSLVFSHSVNVWLAIKLLHWGIYNSPRVAPLSYVRRSKYDYGIKHFKVNWFQLFLLRKMNTPVWESGLACVVHLQEDYAQRELCSLWAYCLNATASFHSEEIFRAIFAVILTGDLMWFLGQPWASPVQLETADEGLRLNFYPDSFSFWEKSFFCCCFPLV